MIFVFLFLPATKPLNPYAAKRDPFADRVDRDQTAHNVQPDLASTLPEKEMFFLTKMFEIAIFRYSQMAGKISFKVFQQLKVKYLPAIRLFRKFFSSLRLYIFLMFVCLDLLSCFYYYRSLFKKEYFFYLFSRDNSDGEFIVG